MSLSVDYDALEATTSIEDMTEGWPNLETLLSLRNDDDLSCLRICDEAYACGHGDYHPGGSERLGWLGHFAKKSTHLEEFCLFGFGIFNSCSKQSVERFFQDIGKCDRIKKVHFLYTDLADIICELGPVINNNSITNLDLENCDLGVSGATNFLSNVFQNMKSLQVLSINDDEGDLNDDIMTGCIPSLADCTDIRSLSLRCLDLSTNSCAALSAVFPRMAGLLHLDLQGNLIDNDCVEALVLGLTECKHLRSLDLSSNRISDDGLDVLIQGLPSIETLTLEYNEITLSRQLPTLRCKKLYLRINVLSSSGPRVMAASLANPDCRLESLGLHGTNIGDDGATILAEGLRNNQRLTRMILRNNKITEAGWNAFSSILCDTTSINATYSSNHTLQFLEDYLENVPRGIKILLELNSDEDKSSVAAEKILQTHHHLDMKPLFGMKLDLLPRVVAWLERFAESRLDHKLSSIYQFARAMPMDVIDGLMGKKKEKKRKLHNA